MTYTQSHLLLSEAWPDRITPDASNNIANFIPANGWTSEAATLLTFEGRYLGVDVDPAPTSFEWSLVPQIGIAHTTSYQRSRPGWRDVTPADLGITVIGATIETTGTPRVVMSREAVPSGARTFLLRVPVVGIGRFRWRSVITYEGAKPGIKTSLTMIETGDSL